MKSTFQTGFEGGNYACDLAAHNHGISIIPNPGEFEWKALLGSKDDTP